MFSYRHAFHAGNHADVLKHLVLLATLPPPGQKDGPLALVDTRTGAGLYRLDGDYAQTSGKPPRPCRIGTGLTPPASRPGRPVRRRLAPGRRPAPWTILDLIGKASPAAATQGLPGSP